MALAMPPDSKQGRVRTRKNSGPPKDKTIPFPPKWIGARPQQMKQEQEQARQTG